MSSAAVDTLLTTRGATRELGAHVVAACFNRAGARAAFALGDGCVHLAASTGAGDWQRVEAPDVCGAAQIGEQGCEINEGLTAQNLVAMTSQTIHTGHAVGEP